MVSKLLVPPDGGYGWLMVVAYAIHHFIAVPVGQMLGIIFKEPFKDLGFTATDISLIMNTNAAFAMFTGIINGGLIKYLGYRKVSLIAATLATTGVFLTAYANSFTHYIVTYGLVTALGTGMGISAYTFALNSYFLKKRVLAVGYALTLSGLGPIFMPQVFSALLDSYGEKGALIVTSGVMAHAYISASLLQPVKRFLVEKDAEEKDEEAKETLLNKGENEEHSNTITNKKPVRRVLTLENTGSICSLHTPLDGSIPSLYLEEYLASRKQPIEPPSAKYLKVRSESNIKGMVPGEHDDVTLNLNKNRATLLKNNYHKVYSDSNIKGMTLRDNNDFVVEVKKPEKEQKHTNLLKRFGNTLVEVFDLTLLTDPSFVNMMLGMSMAVFAEINFSTLTPFIMSDYNLNTHQIATFISVQSITDIIFRFITPYVSSLFDKPVRVMYIWALSLMILTRFTLFLTDDYIPLLACSAFIGLARGFRTVYWVLVVPSSVPIERLPSAMGLQYTCNSIFMWVGGPFLGFVRDITGSFKKSILVINLMTFICICMWTTEFTYKYYKEKKEKARAETAKEENVMG